MEIILPDLPLPIRVIFSARKTIALEATDEGELFIRAPRSSTEQEIHDIASTKAHWFKKQFARMEVEKSQLNRSYQDGASFLWLGQEKKLRFANDHSHFSLDEKGFVMPETVRLYARENFEAWYRHQALTYIPPLAKQLADEMGFIYKRIRINGAKSRWGSCSEKGNINFSWRLMMAPESAIRYVIIHELCHLKWMDHSADFWQLVASWCPDYPKEEKWLRDNGWMCVLPA